LVTGGRGVSIRLTVLLGLVSTALTYLVSRILTGQGATLPQASWGAFIVLVFMACGVFFAGLPVRRFLRGRATKTLNPLRAMRTLVLAQASALTGALVTGWYAGQALVLVPDLDVPSQRSLAFKLAVLAAGGVLMAIAGLAVQAMCRVDPPEPGADSEGEGQQSPDRSSED
jgi:hypothetical protein